MGEPLLKKLREKEDDELYTISIHEAGHALVSALLGLTIMDIQVTEKGGSVQNKINSAYSIEKGIMNCLAGTIAEYVRFAGPICFGSRSLFCSSGDISTLSRVMKWSKNKNKKRYLQRLMMRTWEMLVSHEHLLYELADELYEKRTLTGKELSRMIKDAFDYDRSKIFDWYANEILEYQEQTPSAEAESVLN